jgi:hypothetical protein
MLEGQQTIYGEAKIHIRCLYSPCYDRVITRKATTLIETTPKSLPRVYMYANVQSVYKAKGNMFTGEELNISLPHTKGK